MRKVLVPIDGSENALRALKYAIAQRDVCRDPPHLVLVNVQAPIVSGAVKMFLAREQLNDFYGEQGEAALAPARDVAAASGLALEHHILVGDPAETIAKVAREQACDLIVMGTRGLGTVTGVLLGSVATKVIHLSDRPVLLVK